MAPPDRVEKMAFEMADGHRTILHMAVLMCAPLARETADMTSNINSILKRNSDDPDRNSSGWTVLPKTQKQNSPSLSKSLQSIFNMYVG